MKPTIKKFCKNDLGSVAMIGAAVAILVSLMVSVLIVYNVIDAVDVDSIDGELTGTPCANATNNTLTQTSTFYTIAPLIVVVLAAVIILGYVTNIGRP